MKKTRRKKEKKANGHGDIINVVRTSSNFISTSSWQSGVGRHWMSHHAEENFCCLYLCFHFFCEP